jgi:hypothetical protein
VALHIEAGEPRNHRTHHTGFRQMEAAVGNPNQEDTALEAELVDLDSRMDWLLDT